MQIEHDIPYGFCQCGCGQKTNISDRNRPKQGYVKGEPYPYIANHSKSRGRLDRYMAEDRGYTTPCWIWQGHVDAKGYGSLKVNGKMVKAHRAMYQREVGAIPDGLEIDHLCKVRNCVNPDHMEPVTGIVNIRRGNHVKLSYDDYDEIVRLRDEEKLPILAIAARYGVCRTHVHLVLRERRK